MIAAASLGGAIASAEEIPGPALAVSAGDLAGAFCPPRAAAGGNAAGFAAAVLFVAIAARRRGKEADEGARAISEREGPAELEADEVGRRAVRKAAKRLAHCKFRAASRRRAKTIGWAKPSEARAPAKDGRRA